jgi:hypothetical protein
VIVSFLALQTCSGSAGLKVFQHGLYHLPVDRTDKYLQKHWIRTAVFERLVLRRNEGRMLRRNSTVERLGKATLENMSRETPNSF